MQLRKDEEETIYLLAEKITGSSQRGRWRKTVLLQNIVRRIVATRCASLAAYLDRVARDAIEYRQMVSALTIHVTSWFREADHFELLTKQLQEQAGPAAPPPALRILCAACSTGEEVYSLGLFLENKRQLEEIADYRIVGFDLDPVSVSTAKRAVYPLERLADIPALYRRFCWLGSQRSEGLFTVASEIRQRVQLFDADLRQLQTKLPVQDDSAFDAIICRNVLIYFDDAGVAAVVRNLSERLRAGGLLCLGHSEAIDAARFGFESRSHSIYRRPPATAAPAEASMSLGRVLVVDDSNVVREVLRSLCNRAGLHVHTVESAAAATQFLQEQTCDLITLDLKMPDLDGLSWLRMQRRQGMRLPVVVVSDSNPAEAEDVLGALTVGAQDYIEKRDLSANPDHVADKIRQILQHRQTRAEARTELAQSSLSRRDIKHFMPELILIGASTGGPEALTELLRAMPPDAPPVLVVQHIAAAFASAFARRLARVSGLTLGPSIQDTVLERGHIYLAEGDYHIGVKRHAGLLKLEISHDAAEHSVRPAVDFLFRTAAAAKVKALAMLLTGMGKDGAQGLLELRQQGCLTLAQDEASSVVFGMPREALAVGAVQLLGDLQALRHELDSCLSLIRAKVS